jgi:orotidine-5'-phosphate decarboxylase
LVGSAIHDVEEAPVTRRGDKRLIVALDVATRAEASSLLHQLEGVVSFFKVGQEMLGVWGPDFLDELTTEGREVFVDLKLGDISETTRRTVAVWSNRNGVRFVTIGNATSRQGIAAAKEGRGDKALPQLLYVSYLSSQDDADFNEMYGQPKEAFRKHIERRSAAALEAGCDGLVASGQEIAHLRQAFPDTIIVSPGIRPSGSPVDDHKRSATPAEAIHMGADFLVVGRPIRNAADPAVAARAIIAEIDGALASRVGSR